MVHILVRDLIRKAKLFFLGIFLFELPQRDISKLFSQLPPQLSSEESYKYCFMTWKQKKLPRSHRRDLANFIEFNKDFTFFFFDIFFVYKIWKFRIMHIPLIIWVNNFICKIKYPTHIRIIIISRTQLICSFFWSNIIWIVSSGNSLPIVQEQVAVFLSLVQLPELPLWVWRKLISSGILSA